MKPGFTIGSEVIINGESAGFIVAVESTPRRLSDVVVRLNGRLLDGVEVDYRTGIVSLPEGTAGWLSISGSMGESKRPAGGVAQWKREQRDRGRR